MADLPLTEEELELLDPHPDIHALFVHYNALYFADSLGACSVEWSSARMTLCGGVCEFRPGGGCRIKLSEPLLKLRPSRDLKMVLLHEMIHASMMLQGIRDDDPGGHGTVFRSIMQRINASTLPDHQRPPGGYGITTTHSMFAEVDHYRVHHWTCQRCGEVIKRSMNRPPQEADCRNHVKDCDCGDTACRYHMHAKHCGGEWVKTKEPEGFGQKKGRKAQGAAGASSSGGGGGGAARADGVPVPAKRPKTGGGAAAAGTRPITDFFPTSPAKGAAAGAAGGGEGGASSRAQDGSGPVLPSLQAVTNGGAAAAGRGAGSARQPGRDQQQQQQQQQQPRQQQGQQQQQPRQQQGQQQEPSAEERRRLLAEAATRRLQGGTGASVQQAPQQQQHREQHQGPQQQQKQGQEQQERSREAPAAAAAAGASGRASDAHPGLGAGGGGAGGAEPGSGGAAAAVSCPVCGRRWPGGQLSNAELNAHLDECLTLSSLAA